MRPIPTFNYHRPASLKEAIKLLRKLGDAKVMAGGTDLLVGIRDASTTPTDIVDISLLKELDYIREEGDILKIGALTTHAEILKSALVSAKAPVLADAVRAIGCVQIRNRGTIGGNLCNASPAADTAPPLLVLEAYLEVTGSRGVRAIPITDFFEDPGKTALRRDELLCEVQIPVPRVDVGMGFRKLGRRKAYTLSLVSAAAYLTLERGRCEEARVALGAVAPTPIRARRVEQYVKGRRLTEGLIRRAASTVAEEVRPITDVRASAEYRREMARVFTEGVLLDAYSRVGGRTA